MFNFLPVTRNVQRNYSFPFYFSQDETETTPLFFCRYVIPLNYISYFINFKDCSFTDLNTYNMVDTCLRNKEWTKVGGGGLPF